MNLPPLIRVALEMRHAELTEQANALAKRQVGMPHNRRKLKTVMTERLMIEKSLSGSSRDHAPATCSALEAANG